MRRPTHTTLRSTRIILPSTSLAQRGNNVARRAYSSSSAQYHARASTSTNDQRKTLQCRRGYHQNAQEQRLDKEEEGGDGRQSASQSLPPPPPPTRTRPPPLQLQPRQPSIHLPRRFGDNQLQSISDETRRKLERISGGFNAVRWGVAYGSGVFDQVGYDVGGRGAQASGSASASEAGSGVKGDDGHAATLTTTTTTTKPKDPPLVDFLFATSHPSHFHAINLQKNPDHYPRLFRWLGPGAIARVQEWAGGVWFVTDVDVRLNKVQVGSSPNSNSNSEMGPTSTSTSTSTTASEETVRIKYGIISNDALCTDLLDWTTLYVSGRLHKPVRIVKGQQDRRVLLAAQVNLISALRVALLQLPETFTERALWEQVAGISYSGDPRMSIPGAENPNKVKNIVAPQMHRFRGLYGRLLHGMGGVRAEDEEKMRTARLGDVGGPEEEKREREEAWRKCGLGVDGGEGVLRQDKSVAYRAELLAKLPRTLRRSIATHYCTQFNVQMLKPGEEPQVDGPTALSSDEFWKRVAGVDETELRGVLSRALKGIMGKPALRQSFKGLLTAGFTKSMVYAGRKVGKWWKAKSSSPQLQGVRSMSTSSLRVTRRGLSGYQQIRYASNNTKIVRDGAIPYRTVQLVSSEDNSLGPPQSLASILSSYSTRTHYLHLVSSDPPIVKLIEKKAQQEKSVMQEKKAKAKRARVMETSEVQITWESAKGDLMHKIALVRGILERGDRVEIAFIHKPANTGNLLAGAALKRVQETFPATTKSELADVAKEWKDDRIEPAIRVIYLEPTKEVRDEVLRKLDESADEKNNLKQAKKAERRAKEEERMKRAKAREG